MISNLLLTLHDSVDGYSTIRAGLGRGVDYGTGILMKDLTVNRDAAVSLRRGAEQLTLCSDYHGFFIFVWISRR